MGALSLINYHLIQSSGPGLAGTKRMEKDIHSKNALWFDISEVLAFKLPKNMGRIEKLITQLCGKKFNIYYLYEGPDDAHCQMWFNANGENGIMAQMQSRFKIFCPNNLYFLYPSVWTISTYFGFPKETMKMVIVRK